MGWSTPVTWNLASAMPAPIAEAPVETFVGYVEAWRWWVLHANDPADYRTHFLQLQSESINFEWSMGGETVAIGRVRMDGSAGLYAYKQDSIEVREDLSRVFGRVALYGDVCEHSHGFRAEKGRILDLWCHPFWYDRMNYIPQVKGTYTIHPPTVLDAFGNPYGGLACLTLESQKELSGSSLSDGPTTNLLAYRNPNLFPWTNHPWSQGRINSYGKLESDILYIPEPATTVLRVEGERCSVCDQLICKDEEIAERWDLPEDFETKEIGNDFSFVKKHSHLRCEMWEFGQEDILFC